jgi:GNAT superfamily N-acetyltransferase
MPNVYWVKATYIPTNKIIGVAGWQAPGSPVHTFWRRSATQFYKWDEKYNWSEADVEEMWQGVDMSVWEGGFEKDDKARQEVLGDEPHWYLAPLFTRPEFKGRGIGSMLLKWGIEQADATNPVTPMYLESSEYAVKVYEHVGFVNLGKNSFVRRGPKVKDSSEGLPKAKEEEGTVGKGSTEVVVEEVKAKAA